MKTPKRREAMALHLRWGSLVVSGLLSACAPTPSVVRALPELPAEFARDLAVARTAPVLMTKPAAVAAAPTPRPAGTPVPLALAKACNATLEGYVLFPITVCHPPNDLYGSLDLSAAAQRASVARGTAVPPAQYFKLSSHPQVTVGFPWFCTVRSGPWYGHVEGRQFCNANPNVRSFTAEIVGAPEPVVVVWAGTLDDVPPPLRLVSISQTDEVCVCCSGFTCPNGNCVLDPKQCDAMPPALK